jgi:homoserine kinase
VGQLGSDADREVMSALRATVRVPGVARVETNHSGAVPIDLWLTLSATCADEQAAGGPSSVAVERAGTLRRLNVAPRDDLLVQGFMNACRVAGRTPPARVQLRVSSQIPLSVGLGASAAATVAGALAANALLHLGLDDAAVARACGAIDNDPVAVAAMLSSDCVVQVRSECEPDVAIRAAHRSAVSVS